MAANVKFQKAVLVGCRSWHQFVNRAENSLPGWPAAAEERLLAIAATPYWLSEFTANSIWAGTKRIRRIETVPDDWKSDINIVLSDLTRLGDYEIQMYFAVLTEHSISRYSTPSAAEHFRAEQFFAKLDIRTDGISPITMPPNFVRHTSNLLYLEPNANLIALPLTEATNAFEQVNHLADAIDMRKPAVIPSLIEDTIVFPGISDTPPAGLTAVRIAPLPEDSTDSLHIPRSIIALAMLQITSAISADQTRQLRQHPFVREALDTYFGRLSQQNSVTKHYRGKFIPDQISASLLATRIDGTSEIISQKISDNAIIRNWERDQYRLFIFYDAEYKGFVNNPLAHLIDHSRKANKETTHEIARLRTRSETLSAMLRDAVNIEIAEINLTLQKTVKFLTYVIALLGVAGLLVSLVPEDQKSAIYKRAFGVSSVLKLR